MEGPGRQLQDRLIVLWTDESAPAELPAPLYTSPANSLGRDPGRVGKDFRAAVAFAAAGIPVDIWHMQNKGHLPAETGRAVLSR